MDKAYIDKTLAASQREMVEIFSTCTATDEIRHHIEHSSIQPELKSWLLSCNPNMLETAASLVTKWGSTDPADVVGH
jgi:hypothetical protein